MRAPPAPSHYHYLALGPDRPAVESLSTISMADAPPVEAAAPAKGADVEESLEALRKKVVDSGGPKGVSKQVALEWLRFANAAPIKFTEIEHGLWLDADPGASLKDAYACFFKPVYDRSSGFIRLKCRLGGCKTGPISYQCDSKDAFPFTNAITHLRSCGGPRMLRPKEAIPLLADRGKAAAASAASAAEGDKAGKRPAQTSGVEDHLRYLGLGELFLGYVLLVNFNDSQLWSCR